MCGKNVFTRDVIWSVSTVTLKSTTAEAPGVRCTRSKPMSLRISGDGACNTGTFDLPRNGSTHGQSGQFE
jgi:hypothetical protein